MSVSAVENLLANRGNKAIAIILSSKEELCDPHIPQESAVAMRKVVLDQVNDLVDVALDLIRDAGDNIYNDEYFRRKLDAIYTEVTNGRKA